MPYVWAALVVWGCSEPATEPALGPRPSDVEVWPTVPELPVNGLVFRATFPEPMTLGPHGIHVRDASGIIVPGAVPRVVWDQPMRTATIPIEDVEPGARYTLRIEGLETQAGTELAAFERAFVVLAADTSPPSGAAMRVEGQPRPGGRDPVRVAFPEPVERGSLDSITVLVGGAPAEGAWTLQEGDAVAVFTPGVPWGDDPVRVALGAGIRDLAGNDLVDRPERMLVPMAPRKE